MKRLMVAVPLLVASLGFSACDSDSPTDPDAHVVKRFTVTLSVPSDSPSPLAPGLFAVHGEGQPIFTQGLTDYGRGLEDLAEDGDPSVLALSGGAVFNTPEGEVAPGPAAPGKSYRFSFEASPGHRLSFATMYIESNDAFYAPADTGLALFNGAAPVTGNVTSMISLWDAGTEINQEPGRGSNQPPRQPGPDTGPSERAAVDLISARDNFIYGNALEVTIEVQQVALP